VNPARFALNVVACVLAPAFIAGAVTFAVLDRLFNRDRPEVEAAITYWLTGEDVGA
jgi:hypothetical protein